MRITPNEMILLKEKIIAEYKLEQAKRQVKKRPPLYYVRKKLKQILPINILVGVIASVVLVYINGWRMLGYLFLSGIVWLTLITTIVTALFTKKD